MDPIENGDIPASYVSLPEGIYNIHHGKNMSITFIFIYIYTYCILYLPIWSSDHLAK